MVKFSKLGILLGQDPSEDRRLLSSQSGREGSVCMTYRTTCSLVALPQAN